MIENEEKAIWGKGRTGSWSFPSILKLGYYKILLKNDALCGMLKMPKIITFYSKHSSQEKHKYIPRRPIQQDEYSDSFQTFLAGSNNFRPKQVLRF